MTFLNMDDFDDFRDRECNPRQQNRGDVVVFWCWDVTARATASATDLSFFSTLDDGIRLRESKQ